MMPKRNSNPRDDGVAPSVVLQGRNSVASINSGYTEQRSQPRGSNGGPQILSGTGDTGSGLHHLAGNQQQFVILDQSVEQAH